VSDVFARLARFKNRRTAETHGLDGAGHAAGECGGAQLHRVSPASLMAGMGFLEGQTRARLSQAVLWVLECEAAQQFMAWRIPGRDFPPSRGALASLFAWPAGARRFFGRPAAMTPPRRELRATSGAHGLPRVGIARAISPLPLDGCWLALFVSGGLRAGIAGAAAGEIPPRGVRFGRGQRCSSRCCSRIPNLQWLSVGAALPGPQAGMKARETETGCAIFKSSLPAFIS